MSALDGGNGVELILRFRSESGRIGQNRAAFIRPAAQVGRWLRLEPPFRTKVVPLQALRLNAKRYFGAFSRWGRCRQQRTCRRRSRKKRAAVAAQVLIPKHLDCGMPEHTYPKAPAPTRPQGNFGLGMVSVHHAARTVGRSRRSTSRGRGAPAVASAAARVPLGRTHSRGAGALPRSVHQSGQAVA